MQKNIDKVHLWKPSHKALLFTGTAALGIFLGVSLYFIFRKPRVIIVHKQKGKIRRTPSMDAREKMSKEEMVRIKEFVQSNFNPIFRQIEELRAAFEQEAKHFLVNLQDRTSFKKERVLEIFKFIALDMVEFERSQILKSRSRRRALLNSKKTMSYLDECLRSYALEYADEFERKLEKFLLKMGLNEKEIGLMRQQNDFAELLQAPEIEDLRKLVETKCMQPTRVISDFNELEKLLKYLVAVYYTYSIQPEMAHFIFLIPLCCEDEMYKRFQINGEDISASIFQYVMSEETRLYIYIKDYLEVFVGYQSDPSP